MGVEVPLVTIVRHRGVVKKDGFAGKMIRKSFVELWRAEDKDVKWQYGGAWLRIHEGPNQS